MRTPRSQNGEIQLRMIFWGVVLVVGFIFGKAYVPMKIATMQLKDHIEEMCQLSPRGTADQYRDSIFARAQELKLPLEKKRIKVTKTNQRAVIDIQFPVTLDLIVAQHVIDMEIYIDRDIFLM